jgi:hypothetical protein
MSQSCAPAILERSAGRGEAERMIIGTVEEMVLLTVSNIS